MAARTADVGAHEAAARGEHHLDQGAAGKVAAARRIREVDGADLLDAALPRIQVDRDVDTRVFGVTTSSRRGAPFSCEPGILVAAGEREGVPGNGLARQHRGCRVRFGGRGDEAPRAGLVR